MPLRCLLVALSIACVAPAPATPPSPIPPSGVASDVAYLTSPDLEGRAVGSAGGDRAVIFFAERYIGLGLNGGFASSCPDRSNCPQSYVQMFTANHERGENLVATVPGADPTLRGRYVIVGAHYDHLGLSTKGALDPERGSVLRVGADDNASGTAALLELGRRLARNPSAATVLLAHFDAEELGLIGSEVFVKNSPVPLDSIALMINLDMVGRLRRGRLLVEMTALASPYRVVIDSLAKELGIPLQFTRRTAGKSDHSTFANVGVPSMHFFTGLHSDYHRVSDKPEKVDAAGILRIADLVESIVRTAPTRDHR